MPYGEMVNYSVTYIVYEFLFPGVAQDCPLLSVSQAGSPASRMDSSGWSVRSIRASTHHLTAVYRASGISKATYLVMLRLRECYACKANQIQLAPFHLCQAI